MSFSIGHTRPSNLNTAHQCLTTSLTRLLITRFATSVVIALVCAGAPTFADDDVSDKSDTDIEERIQEELKLRSIEMVNEVSNRRRLTTFFANQQSPKNGVQLNHVNVGKGNMTFAVRDLVAVDVLPIVMSRTYDSMGEDTGDFGFGWKLSIAENVSRQDGKIQYNDGTGSSFELQKHGNRLMPRYPQFSGILEGSISNDKIVLRDQNLIREFDKHHQVFRISKVSDIWGNWLSIDYHAGKISRVTTSGGRHVEVRRDSHGRISSIVDDIGRVVRYEYGDSGLLSSVVALDGGIWTYNYGVNGRLVSVTDPRSKVVLEATSDNDGRAMTVRTLHEITKYDFQGNETTVTDLLGSTATFRQHRSGITDSIIDNSGATTSLVLGPDLQPSEFRFNGSVVASMEYGEGGLLSRLTNQLGEGSRSYDFTYAKDKLVEIRSDERTVAQYEYFVSGALRRARDPDGNRAYEVGSDGSIIGLTVNGSRLALESTNHGQFMAATSDNGSYIRAAYDELDRLVEIDFGGVEVANYEYAENSLRTSAEYGLASNISFGYDQVGNLTGFTQTDKEGEEHTSTYTIDDHNRLLAIDSSYGPTFTFNYDALGRLSHLDAGERRFGVEYDELSRVHQATLDENVVYEADYGPMDVGSAKAIDGKTFATIARSRASAGVFGTTSEILTGRTIQTAFPFIYFDRDMSRYVLSGMRMYQPDRAYLDGLQRMQIPIDGSGYFAPARQFDKPSNPLFIPPEFSSVNCFICDAVIFNHQLNVDGSSAPPSTYKHVQLEFQSSATVAGCWLKYGSLDYIYHTISYGDGGGDSTTSPGWWAYAEFDHKYNNSSGAFVANASMECLCGIFAYSTASKLVFVDPPTVEVQSASIPNAEVVVKLTPQSLLNGRGDLVVEVLDPAAAHTVYTASGVAGGTHTLSIDRNLIPDGEYQKVRATWTIDGNHAYDDDLAYHFAALGTYRHSQYNTPEEAHTSCSGGASSTGYITTNDAGGNTQCFLPGATYHTDTFSNTFLSQAQLNGSARTASYGDVQWDQFCTSHSSAPPGVTSINTHRQQPIVPACPGGTVNNNTVAVDPNHPTLSCGDSVYLDGVGTKTITDYCPGCATAQLDNYTFVGDCTAVPDLGDYKTFKIF